MEKAASTFWRTLTNFKCGKWRFWPDIPVGRSSHAHSLPPPHCSALSSSLLPLHPLAPCWLTSLLTGWRIVATTAQLNVGEAGEVLITKQQAASEAFSLTRSAKVWGGGGGRQEVARLTGQPFNYAVKHGQRPGLAAAAAEAAVKPGTSKVIATAERWKGRSTTTYNNNSERGWAGEQEEGLRKQVKRWKPVAKAHGQSYLLRLGNPGQQLRLPAARQRRMNSKWDAQVAQNCVFSVFICAKLAAEPPHPPLSPFSSLFSLPNCFLAFLFYWAICGRRFNTLAKCGLRQAMLSTCFKAKSCSKNLWQHDSR